MKERWKKKKEALELPPPDPEVLEVLLEHETLPQAMARFLRVPDRDQKRIIPLKLNAAQTGLHDTIGRIQVLNERRTARARAEDPNAAAFEKIQVVIGKCRRGGVSTYVQARAFLFANWRENFRVSVHAHRGENANAIFRYSRDFRRWWAGKDASIEDLRYRQELAEGQRSSKQHLELANGSRFITETSGGDNTSRGTEQDFYHFSEVAFYDDYSEVNAAIAAAPPHCEVYEESTANGPAGGFYERWKNAVSIDEAERIFNEGDHEAETKWNGFIRFFFSWLDDPAYVAPVSFAMGEDKFITDSLDDTERGLIKTHGASLQQIKWRRLKIKSFGEQDTKGLSPEQYFQQEYPSTAEEMFQNSGNVIFDPNRLNGLDAQSRALDAERSPLYLRLDHEQPPVVCRRFEANCIIYEAPVAGAMYSAGCDTGNGIGKDESVMPIFDRTDGTVAREVAVLFSSRIAAEHFADIAQMLLELYNDAFVTPEINPSGGGSFAARLIANRYANIYHRETLDRVKGAAAPSNSFLFGFLAGGNSKNSLINRAARGLKDGTLEVRTIKGINQLRAYTQLESGKLGPMDANDHDDWVIGIALGYWGHTSDMAPPVTTKAMRTRRLAGAEPLDAESAAFWAEQAAREKPLTRVQRRRAMLG